MGQAYGSAVMVLIHKWRYGALWYLIAHEQILTWARQPVYNPGAAHQAHLVREHS